MGIHVQALVRVVVVAALTSWANDATAYQLVLDGEDSAFRTESATWTLDKTGTYLGNYKFSAAGPGVGTARAVWDIDAIPAGTYDVEFYVDNGNFAETAQYIVEHDYGTSTVIRSQNFVGAGWHSIGTFDFGHAGRVTQTDFWTGAGTKVIADAIRITLHGQPALPPVADSVPPEVSLVVDDLGALNPNDPSRFTYQLFNYPQPITYAIIPFLAYTGSVLDIAEGKGLQTILHQPWQYIGQADSNPGDPTRLYISMNANQILNTLNNNLNNVAPHVWGWNNHQGSRFSQHRPGLEVAIQDTKDRNMFFLDSRTISDTVAYDVAREKGLLAAERDLFVDGTSVANTKELIESVGLRALYAPNYNHIMICHQRDATVPGIFQGIDALVADGVKVVSLEHNIHYIVETDKIPPGASVDVLGNWVSTPRDMISHECFDGNALELPHTENGSVTFRPNLPKSGRYRVFVGAPAGPEPSLASVVINDKTGSYPKSVNQFASRNRWSYLGTYNFNAGTAGSVSVRPHVGSSGPGYIRADSVKFVYQPTEEAASSTSDWNLFQ